MAVVTESFLPQINGVTNSVLRVCEHLGRRGHQALVVAPGSRSSIGPSAWHGARVVRMPGVDVPAYGLPVAYPWPGLTDILRDFAPDVVHLASPTLLGAQALKSAQKLQIPTVAVYQTDLASFAAMHGLSPARRAIWSWLRGIHNQADVTLAPSRHAVTELAVHGIPGARLWPRGVDVHRFDPGHRDEALHRRLAPKGEVLVGYVGRLSLEKQVDLLAGLDRTPGLRVVVIGDGPQRSTLSRLLPGAHFLGQLDGEELAAAFATLDVFVHTGAHETFCQAVQEALASGVPVVAPASGGPLDLIEPGVTGLFYPGGDQARLHEAVRDLAGDGERRVKMGQAARGWVAGRDWEAVGDLLLDHYRAVAAARSAGVSA